MSTVARQRIAPSRAELSYNDPAADFRFARAGACSDVLLSDDETGGIQRQRYGRAWRSPRLALPDGDEPARRPGARGGNLRVRPLPSTGL